MYNELKIITLNVIGVLKTVKRIKILSTLTKERAHYTIAYFQDTCISDSVLAELNIRGFKYVFASSYTTAHKRGK